MNNLTDNWQLVCKEEDIDMDDLIRFDFGEATFCIYKIKDGFYATDGICTHEAVHLEDGLVTDGEIECPMHQGIFDIKTGKAKSAPACVDLKTYPVKSEEGKIFIQINK
ncbi:non-heme iron oxygenase ferredoxin subunit [Alphaproteobacteria bacterium]|nr:non-heme iron oxygenase ferredoxin subunit [Alphaproteobacteria bacterium]